MTRHWSINGRFLTQPLTGVQRYAVETVRALDEALDRGQPFAHDLAIDVVVPQGARCIDFKNIKVVRHGSIGGHAWEQAVLPAVIKGGLLSLGNAGPVFLQRQIVCMHDMNTRAFPESYSMPFRALNRLSSPLLGRFAGLISTVSEHSANELVRYGVCERDKIVVAANGHEHVRRWTPRHSALTRSVAGANTIVMIGTPAPHKNINLVLNLADALATAGLRVALVGERNEAVHRTVGPVRMSNNIVWLGRLDDGEIAALLADSMCLAFPSLAEGFGLPPLEAMAIGCPVVASNRASLPEICGSAVLYASPEQPDAWMNCFVRLRQDANLRCELRKKGSERAKAFSWDTTAQVYLEAMYAVDMSSRRRNANILGENSISTVTDH